MRMTNFLNSMQPVMKPGFKALIIVLSITLPYICSTASLDPGISLDQGSIGFVGSETDK